MNRQGALSCVKIAKSSLNFFEISYSLGMLHFALKILKNTEKSGEAFQWCFE